MRKYYLFHIQKDFYNIYLNSPEVLYKTLENLYHIDKTNINYGISIFDQICQGFPTKAIEDYIEKKYEGQYTKNKNKIFLQDQDTILEYHYSTLILLSASNFPTLLFFLHYISSRIFVCDFEEKDYFWLHNYVTQRI